MRQPIIPRHLFSGSRHARWRNSMLPCHFCFPVRWGLFSSLVMFGLYNTRHSTSSSCMPAIVFGFFQCNLSSLNCVGKQFVMATAQPWHIADHNTKEGEHIESPLCSHWNRLSGFFFCGWSGICVSLWIGPGSLPAEILHLKEGLHSHVVFARRLQWPLHLNRWCGAAYIRSLEEMKDLLVLEKVERFGAKAHCLITEHRV